MRTFEVTVSRTGTVRVQADYAADAMNIANSMSADKITWDDDFLTTDVMEINPSETEAGNG